MGKVIEKRRKEMANVKGNYDFNGCFAEFKSIGKKENEKKYSEWKAGVKERIKSYNDANLKDLIKKVEISKDVLEKENFLSNIFDLLSKNIPILTVFITVMVALYVPTTSEAINIQLAMYSAEEVKESANELINVIKDNYLSFGEVVKDSSIFLLILNTIVWIISVIVSSYRTTRVRYYNFLLKVLRNED